MISPLRVRETGTPMQGTWTRDNKTPVDLTGMTTVELVFRDKQKGRRFVGAGNLVVVDAINGVVRYDWDESDLAKPGTYLLQLQATDGVGHEIDSDEIELEVQPKL